jgi:hypothetical protein
MCFEEIGLERIEKLIRKTIIALLALTMVFSMALCEARQEANVTPTISREYIGRGWQLEFLPTGVLYDPYGDGSYQKVKTTKTISISTDYSSTVSGVVVSGSSQVSMTFDQSYSSSTLTDPSHLGPGKGDLIVGQIYNLTWDLWYVIVGLRPPREYLQYNLVSSSKIGNFYCSRQDLANFSNNKTQVEDKTGQVGPYRNLMVVSAGYPIEDSISYSWSGSTTTGFDIDVSILGFQAVKMTYTITGVGTQTFMVTNHYYDSQSALIFYENAGSANSTTGFGTVYSYVFWFSPYS